MKRISLLTSLALFAAVVLLLGTTSCTKEDNPVPIDVTAMEQDLVGLWWDEYEYADVTEDGVPFSRVLLAVYVSPDHTGWIGLAAYDDTSDEAVALYGGPDEAAFTWQLLANGTIVLGDPETGETYELARSVTRAGGSGYGNNMTNPSNTNLTYTNGRVTASNGNYTGSLNKADAGKGADIMQKFRTSIQSNVGLESGGKTPSDFTEDDIR